MRESAQEKPGTEADKEAPLAQFLQQVLEDLRKGEARSLEEYQKLFPGFEAEIAGAFVRLEEHVAEIVRRREATRPLSERLENRFGEGVDPGIELADPEGAPGESPSEVLLERLAAHAPMEPRYRFLGKVSEEGGMGVILKVFDEDLHRTLAMKVPLGRRRPDNPDEREPVDTETLARFLEEAQVAGQLDHPGMVPVHELGLDSEGRVYFTMRLVRGRNLREIFDRVKEGDEGWSQTRALGVLLRVCEAMGYAHSKGVIHRDLKPGNVMVGRFGEVYVMDWGLARVIGREDTKDPQLRPAAPKTVQIDTARAREREVDPLTPLVTTGGRILGTPSYMPPEQARGEVDKLDRRSDVYAIGAMLYHLLAGEAPYVPRGMRVSGHTIWKWVLDGPPKPLREPNPNVPPELEAICEKAMAREQDGRYADTMELAEDLRAYLEHGVVKAYESGALAVFRKWVERSRMAAAAIAQERDFDELCRSNPELQGELRRLRAFWHKMAGRMRWHGVQPDLLPGVALNLPREEPDEPERVYRPLSRGERTVIRELISVTMAPGSPRPEEPERSGVPSHRRYEILRPMAEGGAGTVYMAWDRQLRRHVALKSLRGSDPDKGRIRRFLQGALIPARLHHPGILPVFDGGLDEEGRPFLAMPYVRGVSLREAIREVHEARGGSSWTLRRGVEVLADVCDAVAYAHSRGVIHRDLKPSNILVDPFGAAYVFDWGLAKIVGPREKGEEEESAEEATSGLTETVEGQVFGTPAYMAPEAALGRTDLIDARTDVYGLGAILFELLTGSYPWSHVRPESAAQLLKLILSGPPVSLRALAPQVPAPLAAICEKAMARARESRYSSAAELGADLRAWLEGRAARAYDSGPLARALAWGRRNRGMAAVLGAFVVILVRWATLEFGD